MPQIDTQRWRWITDREKAAGKALFEKALATLAPPYAHEEWDLLHRDPWQYVTNYVKRQPTREQLAGIMQKIGETGVFEGVNPFRVEKTLEKLKGYFDTSKMTLMTDKEKEALGKIRDKVLNAVTTPANQEEYQQMKSDPIGYVTQKVKEAPSKEAQAQMINNLAGAMPIAFHGSPHKFEKFDIGKVGTGQGAQSYGHGLYFAENPQVAETYRNELIGNRWVAKDAEGTWRIFEANIFRGGEHAISEPFTVRQKADEALKNMPRPGAMYKVNIPDEHVAKMLDWDKPLSEQAPEIQKALTPLIPERFLKLGGMPAREFLQANSSAENLAKVKVINAFENSKTGTPAEVRKVLDEAYKNATPEAKMALGSVWAKVQSAGMSYDYTARPDRQGEEIYRRLISDLGSPEAASQKLKDLGIPGIKYLDQGSRQAGQGTRNFVVFDPDIIEMLEPKAASIKNAILQSEEWQSTINRMRPTAGNIATESQLRLVPAYRLPTGEVISSGRVGGYHPSLPPEYQRLVGTQIETGYHLPGKPNQFISGADLEQWEARR